MIRFDGTGFRLFEHDNTPTLPAGHVLDLGVDSEGVLWVTMESPHLMRYRGGKFEQAYPEALPPIYSPLNELGATAIARGTRMDLLIAAGGGPRRYSTGKITPIRSDGDYAAGVPLSIAETGDGVVWVRMRDSGLFRIQAGRGLRVTGVPDQKVNVLLPGMGPELWIGTDSGLVRWDGSNITHGGVPAALSRSPILALARDRDSNIWVSTSSGVARIDSSGSISETDAGAAVHAIFEDREGNLWLGGSDGLLQLRDSPFRSYNGVAAEGGSMYVDTSLRTWVAPAGGGLFWIRGEEHHPITSLGLEGDVIYSISGGPGELWVGRRNGGVTQLREEDGILHPQTYTTADGLAPGAVTAVHRSRDGTVWAGTLSGAVSRIQKDHITTFTANNGLSTDAVTTIEEMPDGAVWVGTTGGLDVFRNGNWRRYGGEDGLPPGRVNSLALDGEGILWIGSSAGLFYWSGTQIEGARSAPDPLRGEIYALATDNAGNLWASTDRRVVRISRAPLLRQSTTPVALREFITADGLPSTRGIRRDHSVVKDSSGRIWFSLQGGICVVNASRPAVPALVNLESASIDGRPLGTGFAARYSSGRQRVIFNFVGVSLAVPGRVRYRYMLDGYDHEWSQPTDSREVAYNNLSPSRYTFRVMASNSEGLWNGVPASMAFEAEPQLWQTWWFQLMALCLVAASIFAGFRYRVARIRAAMNLRFEERLLERTRIARNLHDTLLQSFQGLMLPLQVVYDLLPPGEAKERLEQTLEGADQAIDEGRRAVHNLRASTVTRNDLAEALRTATDELMSDQSTTFRLGVDGSALDLHPILRDEVYRIGCEGLRNAFKHARASQIEAEITMVTSCSGYEFATMVSVFLRTFWNLDVPGITD